MDRRRFLVAAVVGVGGLAGCTTGRERTGGGSPTDGAETRATATRMDGSRTEPTVQANTGDLQRRTSIANLDDVPGEYDLRIEVELLQETITPEHTARLRLTAIDGTSRKRRIGIGTGDCGPFNREKGRSDPPGLWLLTPDGTNDTPTDGRWTVERNAFAAYGCAFVAVRHDEPIVNRYEVWDNSAVDGYMKPDTYRFETSITVGGSAFGTAATTTERAGSFTWGFDLTVEGSDS